MRISAIKSWQSCEEVEITFKNGGNGQRGCITRQRALTHVYGLPQAVYSAEHDVKIIRAAMQRQNDSTPVSLQEFQKRVKQGYPAFELLHKVAEGR